MPSPVAIVDDLRFDGHEVPYGQHPECPERLVAAREGLFSALQGCAQVAIATRPAQAHELERVHQPRYLRTLREQLRGGAGRLDGDTFFNSATEEASWHAAGGGVALVETLLADDGPQQGVALLRPPGHHAEADRAMGFCFLNNIAIAAAAALAGGARRVAIVDFDVHHGNGTQNAFYADGDVLFISLHQSPFYPGTGHPSEVGKGAGLGRTMNIALPAGAGSAAYSSAMRSLIAPALNRFQPDLILVSAGFDGHVRDPLADLCLPTAGYHALVSSLRALAERNCKGRIAFFLEGGYDLQALKDCTFSLGRALRDETVALDEDRPTHNELAALAKTAHYLLETPAMDAQSNGGDHT